MEQSKEIQEKLAELDPYNNPELFFRYVPINNSDWMFNEYLDWDKTLLITNNCLEEEKLRRNGYVYKDGIPNKTILINEQEKKLVEIEYPDYIFV